MATKSESLELAVRILWTVAAALPLSLLAAIFVIDAIGYNLNLLSTVGLLIAVGLLIDSAIVINENIARHASRGLPMLEAASQGVREVAGAVVSSFLTSVAIFTPLAFLEGDIGRVLLVLPVVLICVGVSDDVYALGHYFNEAEHAEDSRTDETIVAAFSSAARPVGMTAVSTVVGLLSMAAVSLNPLRVFRPRK